MFHMFNSAVWRRGKLFDYTYRIWTSDWTAVGTLSELSGGGSIFPFEHVKCYDLESGKFLGWLGCTPYGDPFGRNYTWIIPEEKDAHGVRWSFTGDDLYLRKDTRPGDRYLGLSDQSRAGWGLPGGWRNPVLYNDDGTVSLRDEPQRKLYVNVMDNAKNYLAWTDGTANRYIVRLDLPFPEPTSKRPEATAEELGMTEETQQ
ncbi:hypothetical protein KV557_09250 [Kitasatospora aureofaciens]|nr:hypothetical protein [Kitasatospora aureofaciens]MBV6697309.1 hypothetical protein [Kitasatospora aureofaciens]